MCLEMDSVGNPSSPWLRIYGNVTEIGSSELDRTTPTAAAEVE